MNPKDLKNYRVKRNLTQRDAAAKLKVTLPRFQQWEQGRYPIDDWVEAYIRMMETIGRLRRKLERLRAKK